MKKIIALINNIKNSHTAFRSEKGFFRPLFVGGSTVYQRGTAELVVSDPKGELEKQEFSFSYQKDGKKVASGVFTVNAFTGYNHVETRATIGVTSFSELEVLMWEIRQFVYDTVTTMASLCYQKYTETVKKQKRSASRKKTRFTMGADPIPFTPQVVNGLASAAQQDVVEVEDIQISMREAAEVKILCWARKGCWCTSKLGRKYWRKGGICHRHM